MQSLDDPLLANMPVYYHQSLMQMSFICNNHVIE